MASNNQPFGGFLDHVSAVDMLRAAASIDVPNRAFRDRNTALYTGTVSGEDSLTWNQSYFRDWYYHGVALGDAYGSNDGAKRANGAYDAESMYFATSGTATALPAMDVNHLVLSASAHTGMIPFSRFYQAHYQKAITFAMVARIPTDVTIGTNIKAYIACYDSDYDHLEDPALPGEDRPFEITFDDNGELGTSLVYQRLLGHTTQVLPATTAYIMLHIGVNSPDGVSTGYEISEVSLMLNAGESSLATSSPVEFIDLADVGIHAGAGMQFSALGVTDRTMLDGTRKRSTVIRDNLKYTFSAMFDRNLDDDAFRQLLSIWNLGTRGMGYHVPEPRPVCIDFGLGTGPFFAPFWPESASFSAAHFPVWQPSDPGYDVSMTFREA